MKVITIFFATLFLCGVFAVSANAKSMIFFHPDGLGMNSWQALRYVTKGPAGKLHWDRLPHTGVYVGNMKDAAVATSHGGATSHAYGVKVKADSYGMDGTTPIRAASGFEGSLMQELMQKGYKTALVNSGDIVEPGTGVFVASSPNRRNYDDIAVYIIHSGVDIILSGGERNLLPSGVKGRHGNGARRDDRNLIEEAKRLGYEVVYTAEELANILPQKPQKLLGVFAHGHSFNDKPEHKLEAKSLPRYVEGAPTIAQMMDATLQLLHGHEFFIVAEEEGTDNFSNVGNPQGTLTALARADEALGVIMNYYDRNSANVDVILASDSDAGGIQIQPGKISGKPTYHYTSEGETIHFSVSTVGKTDYAGGILARSTMPLPAVVDNTDIYKVMHDRLITKP
ncbi:MAG: alkaline phosphatase [Rickettsiales bacterium]